MRTKDSLEKVLKVIPKLKALVEIATSMIPLVEAVKSSSEADTKAVGDAKARVEANCRTFGVTEDPAASIAAQMDGLISFLSAIENESPSKRRATVDGLYQRLMLAGIPIFQQNTRELREMYVRLKTIRELAQDFLKLNPPENAKRGLMHVADEKSEALLKGMAETLEEFEKAGLPGDLRERVASIRNAMLKWNLRQRQQERTSNWTRCSVE